MGVGAAAATTNTLVEVEVLEVEDVLLFGVVVEALDVVFEVVVVVLLVVLALIEVDGGMGAAVEPPGVRYQLAGPSLRHSPAVTPFHPLFLIKSK